MSEYEKALLKDPGEMAARIIDLDERIAELEAKVDRLVRLNRLRDLEK